MHLGRTDTPSFSDDTAMDPFRDGSPALSFNASDGGNHPSQALQQRLESMALRSEYALVEDMDELPFWFWGNPHLR